MGWKSKSASMRCYFSAELETVALLKALIYSMLVAAILACASLSLAAFQNNRKSFTPGLIRRPFAGVQFDQPLLIAHLLTV